MAEKNGFDIAKLIFQEHVCVAVWCSGQGVASCLHLQKNRVRILATLFSVSLYRLFVCFFLCSIWFLVRFFLLAYRKIPKISPGAYIFQRPLIFEGLIFGGAYIRRGLCMEGNLRFKID